MRSLFLTFAGVMLCLQPCSAEGLLPKEREAHLRSNMRLVQLAAESFASDSGGVYPRQLDSKFRELLRSYCKTAGAPLLNPVTGSYEWPRIRQTDDVRRLELGIKDKIGRGSVEYSVLFDANHRVIGYVIRAGSIDSGLPIRTSERTFTLTNQ